MYWEKMWLFSIGNVVEILPLEKGRKSPGVCLTLLFPMTVKVLSEHHLGFLSLKGISTGSSESKLIKMPQCWKSHVTNDSFFLKLSGKTSFVRKKYYHVVLILTVEQERAIIDLFKQRQWKYVKAGKRLNPFIIYL